MAAPPQATAYLTDVIDYLTEEIIFAKYMSDRYEKWEMVEFFWEQLPMKPSHGRLFARYKLAKMMTAVAHTDPYSLEDPVVPLAKKKKSLLSPPLSLVQWTPNHWKDLMNLLQTTRDILLRQDADMLQGENDEDNDERAESDLYNQKMERLITYIRINQALADFRATVQEQLVDKDATVKVDVSILAKFGEIVEQEFSDEADERNRQALESLLVRGKPNTNTRSHGVSLVSTDELRAILANKPFCLATLSHRLTLLLQRWARDVFANKPTLNRLGYAPNMLLVASTTAAVKQEDESDSDEEQEDVKQPARQSSPMPVIEEESEDNDENETPSRVKDARRPKRKRDTAVDPNLEKLKSARRDLQKDGKDPMQEIQRIAATATRSSPRTARLLDKKKSATRVQFGDSDEDDSGNEEENRAHLSEVPTRAKLPTPKSKSPKAKKVTGGKQKRVPFSNEEKTAIRRGVEQFGVGHWSEIKSEYAVILKNRTSVNIKDCYRTMKKKGEL